MLEPFELKRRVSGGNFSHELFLQTSSTNFKEISLCSFLFISLPWWISCSWNVRNEIVPSNNPKVFIELSIVSYDPFFLVLSLYPISKSLKKIQSVSLYTNKSVSVCCGVVRPWTFRHHKNFKLQQTPIDRRSERECE